MNKFRKDVYSQVKHLQRIRLPKSTSFKRGLIVGSGDSYTCALLMEYLSDHKFLAYHPSDILRCPQMLLGNKILFLSASGRTRSNIEAAKIARKFGNKTIAVTARSKSALEAVCNETLNLDYLHTPESAEIGILEFTSTVITCMALIGINIDLNFLGKMMSDAREQVKLNSVDFPTRFKSILFLGDSISYPLASYGALKMHELFGFRSFGYLLDDYYHSPIFSLKKTDCVFILDHEEVKNSLAAIFHNKLKKTHSRTYHFQPNLGRTRFERIIFSIFVIQILGLVIAEKLKIDKPYYRSNNQILKLSSNLIY